MRLYRFTIDAFMFWLAYEVPLLLALYAFIHFGFSRLVHATKQLDAYDRFGNVVLW